MIYLIINHLYGVCQVPINIFILLRAYDHGITEIEEQDREDRAEKEDPESERSEKSFYGFFCGKTEILIIVIPRRGIDRSYAVT